MKTLFVRLCMVLLVTALPGSSNAQKVKVGYDKGVDFAQYTTYVWTEPDMPPSRPMLYAMVVASIDHQLKSKGLVRAETEGDLILTPAGGIEFGLNAAAGTPVLPSFSGVPPAIDATMWTGARGSSASMTPSVPSGTLIVNFVDRKLNRIIWTGSVMVNLDMEHKSKSIELIDKSIAKLLKKFPPQKR